MDFIKNYLIEQFAVGNEDKQQAIDNAIAKLKGQSAHFLWVTDPFENVDPVRLMYILQLRHILLNFKNCKITILINDLHWKEKYIAKLLNNSPDIKREDAKEIAEQKLNDQIPNMTDLFKRLDLKGNNFELLCDSYIYSDFSSDESKQSPIISLIRYVEIRDIIAGAENPGSPDKKHWSFCGDFLETFLNATVIKSNFILTSNLGARHGWLSTKSRLLSEMYDNVPVVLEMPTLNETLRHIEKIEEWEITAQDKCIIDEEIFKLFSESAKFKSLNITQNSIDTSDCLDKLKRIITTLNYD